MAGATAPRWNRLEHDERRSQILAAARRLFGERQYSAVSTEEIANAAGVARGLLNHYFGTKRDLYLEVVTQMLRLPAPPVAPPGAARPLEIVIGESVDRFLEQISRFRETWFASLGAEGFGRDAEVEAIVSAARDETVELIIVTLGLQDREDDRDLRTVLRTYAGLAEMASREWLQHKTLSRAGVHALLSTALLALVRDVAPAVAAAQSRPLRGRTS